MLNSTLAAIVSPMEDSNIVQHGGHINHAMVKREVEEECHRTNLMGTLTQNARYQPIYIPSVFKLMISNSI